MSRDIRTPFFPGTGPKGLGRGWLSNADRHLISVLSRCDLGHVTGLSHASRWG